MVVVTGRDAARGEEVVKRIDAAGGRAVFVAADLGAGGSAVRRLAAEATAAGGGTIGILVNNAAALVPAQSMFDATEEQIDRVLALNIRVPFLLTAALAPAMIEAGAGAVVNVGSVNGLTGMSVAALYGASKGGLALADQVVRGRAGAQGRTGERRRAGPDRHRAQ
jgi:NAD(P)-dependent dehydrogenase (short-subunit alcohol dehydrogenase family)